MSFIIRRLAWAALLAQFAASPIIYAQQQAGSPQSENAAAAARAAEEESQYGPIVKFPGAGVTAPVLTHKVDPKFTDESRREKFMGIVLVNMIVDKEGVPRDVHILRGVGMGLDESAVAAVSKYRFKPALKNGVPVATRLNVEVNFQVK